MGWLCGLFRQNNGQSLNSQQQPWTLRAIPTKAQARRHPDNHHRARRNYLHPQDSGLAEMPAVRAAVVAHAHL